MKKKDLLSVRDLSAAEIVALIKSAVRMKAEHRRGREKQLLRGKVLGLFFHKPSTRTRVSFQVGIAHLGGSALMIPPADLQMQRGETMEDTANVLSRYLDGLIIRTYSHGELENWAAHASIPVINGLSDFSHPCQILSDLTTIKEHFGKLRGLRIAYVGDGNNVAHSWIFAAGILGLNLTLAVPRGFDPDPGVLSEARRRYRGSGKPPRVVRDPLAASSGADVIYTDVWTSMGQEKERARKMRAFRKYQINSKLLSAASKRAVVMHCLPAHRGEEITSDVLDGPRSIVLDQAENRLHLQKALLVNYLVRKK